jgi:hypothetical protein
MLLAEPGVPVELARMATPELVVLVETLRR